MATIQGSASSEPLTGTTGNDTINGAGGSDTIDGLAGTDTAVFSSNSINFQITELSGIVQVKALSTAIFPYQFTTTKLINTEKIQFTNLTRDLFLSANNIILNNNFASTITGTAGNDTIDGYGQSSFIDGGAGTDTAVFFGNRSGFKITALSGAVRVTGLNNVNTTPIEYVGDTIRLINTEKVQFTDDLAPVELTPTTNNIILNNNFLSTITGTAGNDTIDGYGRSSFIDGGAGTDTAVFFANRSDFNIVNLSGVIHVTGLSAAPSEYRVVTAQLSNIEKIQFLDSIAGLNGYNNPPTGSVHINVTNPSAGQTLTAFNDLDDADGVGTITYQWKAGGVNIGVGQTYQVTASDIGKAITVTRAIPMVLIIWKALAAVLQRQSLIYCCPQQLIDSNRCLVLRKN